MTIPIVRQRAKAPKTRTGCKTCRARHIKCDEGRPACQRCMRSNRECAGYDAVAPPRQRNDFASLQPRAATSSESSTPSSSSSTIWPSPRSITVDLSAVELQLLDFFRLQTVHQLPGNSWALSWEKLALHTGAHEPAVSHAAIALSSLHRGQSGLALAQCNKAMSYARARIESLASGQQGTDSDVEIIILVSLLLFCFEVWRAQDYRAAMHLRTGQNILYERVRPKDAAVVTGKDKKMVKMPIVPRSNMDLLLQTFVRLGSDLTISRGSDAWLKGIVHEPIPACFSSLEEALIHLDALSTKIYAADNGLREVAVEYLCSSPNHRKRPVERTLLSRFHPDFEDVLIGTYSRRVSLLEHPDLEAQISKLKKDLCQWMSALACVPVNPEHEAAHLLVQMQVFDLWYAVCNWREPNEMFADRFEEQFEHILSQAERYVSLQRKRGESMAASTLEPTGGAYISRPGFSLGTNLITCVIGIAMKCRKSTVRRRCIDLLAEINLAGVFDTAFVVGMTQTMIDLEETQARVMLGLADGQDLESHQVPLEARIFDIDMAARPSARSAVNGATEACLHSSTGPLREEAYCFYKRDTGILVYACYGADGEIEVCEKEFTIMRGSPRHGRSCEGDERSSMNCVDPALLGLPPMS